MQSKAHSCVRKFRNFEKSLIPILYELGENFEYQKVIKVDESYRGKRKYYIVLDFYLDQYKLDIEMDGNSWHDLDEDKIRDEFLDRLGIKVFRISDSIWNNLNHIQRVDFVRRKLCELKVSK